MNEFLGKQRQLGIGTTTPAYDLDLRGNPKQEFSWIIYGVRNDAFAVKNPIVVEQIKGDGNKYTEGEYIHPEVFEDTK